MPSWYPIKIILLSVLIAFFDQRVAGEGSATGYDGRERDALYALKATFNHPFPNKNWSGLQCYLNFPPYWYGIQCVNGRVTGVLLENMGLTGTIKFDAFHLPPRADNTKLSEQVAHREPDELRRQSATEMCRTVQQHVPRPHLTVACESQSVDLASAPGQRLDRSNSRIQSTRVGLVQCVQQQPKRTNPTDDRPKLSSPLGREEAEGSEADDQGGVQEADDFPGQSEAPQSAASLRILLLLQGREVARVPILREGHHL